MTERAVVRPRVEAIPFFPIQGNGAGFNMYLKVSKNDDDLWTIGGMTLGEDGRLVQHADSREPFDAPLEIIPYAAEALLHLDRAVEMSR